MTRKNANLVRMPAPSVCRAFVAPVPMTPRVDELVFDEGETVAQILTRAVQAGSLDLHDLDRVEVYLDGLPLADRERGLDLRPRADELVNIVVMPAGGGGGGNGNKASNFARQLATLAVAYIVGGPMAAITMAVAQVGGQFGLVGKLFSSKKKAQAEEQVYSLSGQSNQDRRGKSMMLVGGQARVAFDAASTAFTTNVGDDVFVTAIYGGHFGPSTVADLKLGETLVADMPAEDVQIEMFLTPGPRASTLYPMRTPQESYTDELEFGADWTQHTTFEDAERIQVDITFPNGLCFNKENGKTLPQEVRGTVQYRPYAGGAWTAAPLPPAYDRNGVLLPAGDWYVQAKSKKKAVRRTFEFTPPVKGKYDVRVKAWDPDNDDPDLSNYTTMWTALRTIEDRAPITDETLSIIVARFRATSTVNGVAPPLTGVVTPIVPVLVDGEWTGDPLVYSAAWQPSSNAVALARYMLTGYPAARPMSADQIDASFDAHYPLVETMDWRGCVEVTDDSQQDALVRLGYMGRFSTYWNGQAMCLVPDWEKPAARQVFTGRNAEAYAYRRGFPDEIHGVVVEFDNLDRDGLGDELEVYADGYSKHGGLVGGVETLPAEILLTLSLPFKATANRAFREGRVWLAKRIHHSEEHAWSSGADALASTFGDRVLVRHTSTLFGLGEARVQFRRMTGALVSGVRLDSAVTMEAGKTYALDVRRDDGPVLRGLVLATTPGTVREVAFAAPLAVGAAPRRDDLVVFGEVEVLTEDVELTDYAPSTTRKVALSARPYRFEAIEAAETGPIPPLQTRLTVRGPAPKPLILACSGSPEGAVMSFAVDAQRTAPIRGFTARWRPSPSEDDTSPAWTTLELIPADRREARTPAFPDTVHQDGDIEAEFRIDFEIRTLMVDGDASEPSVAEGVLIQRGVPTPVDFAVGGLQRFAPDGSSYPVLSVSAQPVEAGLVQDLVVEQRFTGEDDEAWRGAVQLPAAAPYGDVPLAQGGRDYDARACWRTADGWKSPWVVRAGISVPANALVSSDTRNVEGRPGEQIKNDADQQALSIAAEEMRGSTWRAKTDEVIGQIRTVVEQLGVITADHQVFITFMMEVDGAGAAKVVLSTNVDGHITGTVQTNDGTMGEFAVVDDVFSVVAATGAPIKVFTVNTVTGKVEFRADVTIHGNLIVIGSIETPQLAPQSVVVPVTTVGSSTISCDGTNKLIISHTVNLAYDAPLFVTCALSTHFPGGDKNWTATLYIDGNAVFDCGGANGEATMTLMGALYCTAGPRLVEVRLNSHSSVNVTSRTLSTMGPMR